MLHPHPRLHTETQKHLHLHLSPPHVAPPHPHRLSHHNSKRYQQRPRLNRLLHLTPLNPLGLHTIDETACQARFDNETIHRICQDYVMEILEALERECVIDLKSELIPTSDLDSNASGDDDPDTPLKETGDEGPREAEEKMSSTV
ncbi:hypothetical protein GJ744_005752 [Endocarpon pusillum]|uniref:Uncharacterized protein n=1 Tax=Endocarpon pusillum TaxID=364733 RepID=A0A8H7AQ34_9EURO|nr:hypothetical protein GJ744_005752 [Endocarpon pusillum]